MDTYQEQAPQGSELDALKQRIEQQAEQIAEQRTRIAALEAEKRHTDKKAKIPCKLLERTDERRLKAWAAMGILIRYGAIPMPIIDVVSADASNVLFELSAVLGIVELSIEAADLIDSDIAPRCDDESEG